MLKVSQLTKKYQSANKDHALTVLDDVSFELEAGDTFCYDVNANKDKQEREAIAARNIYGRLPNALGEELLSLWEEFERGDTPEARFAAALDRAQPIFNNYYSDFNNFVPLENCSSCFDIYNCKFIFICHDLESI